jgi:hypothetical protein
MKVLPKQRSQSKPPLSQKPVVVMLEPEDVELSGSGGVELSESVDGVEVADTVGDVEVSESVVDVESSEPDSEDGQVSSPLRLSPGL